MEHYSAGMSEEEYLSKYYRQLLSIGLPESLYGKLYCKIHPELVYDAGSVFVFNEATPSSNGLQLCAKVPIPKNSDVFIVDHAWSHDGGLRAWQQLQNMPELVSRMLDMFGVAKFDDEWVRDSGDYIECDDAVCKFCDCSMECSRLALEEHKGSILDAIIGIRSGNLRMQTSEKSKTECSFEEFKLALKSCLHNQSLCDVSEEYLKKMYESFKKTEVHNSGAAITAEYSWSDNIVDGFIEISVAIRNTTHKYDIKSVLTANHWHLEVEDMGVLVSGDFAHRINPEESFWTIETPGVLSMYLRKGDINQQNWTELLKGERQLSATEIEESVWNRNLKLMTEAKSVLDEMWKYSQTYCVASLADEALRSSPVWYIMDEVGSAMGHSSTPNFACKPLFLFDKGLVVSVIWPLRDIEPGDTISRMFIQTPCPGESYGNFSTRTNVLVKGIELFECNSSHDDSSHLIDGDQPVNDSTLLTKQPIRPKGLGNVELVCFKGEALIHKKTFFCDFIDYADFAHIASALGCNITNELSSADVILSKSWLRNVSDQCMVNHFTGEEDLFNKRHLFTIIGEQCATCPWYPKVYSLYTEVSKILIESKSRNFNQLWVLRSDDSEELNCRPVLTSDYIRITKLIESGFSVASKYILNLAMYNGRCFSLSYLLYIKRLLPTEIFIHKTPYIREASAKYNFMSLLNEYDTTAIFAEKPRSYFSHSKSQNFTEFVSAMEERSHEAGLAKTWTNIETEMIESIATLFRIFEGSLPSPSKTGSFGIIGVDFVLDSNLNPIFLSFNRMAYYASHLVLEDVLNALLYNHSGNALPCESSFFKVTL